MRLRANAHLTRAKICGIIIQSIFFGGGTPYYFCIAELAPRVGDTAFIIFFGIKEYDSDY